MLIYHFTFLDHGKSIKKTVKIYNIPVLDGNSIILKSHLHTQQSVNGRCCQVNESSSNYRLSFATGRRVEVNSPKKKERKNGSLKGVKRMK